jgi:hypothetical protein
MRGTLTEWVRFRRVEAIAPHHRDEAMTAPKLPRRALLAAPLLLAACGGPETQANFPPVDYEYLTKLKLNVASVEIDNNWVSHEPGRHVESLAPTPPADALRRMGQDRLVAVGNSGQAKFVIDEASIVAKGGQYVGNFAVHLDVATSDGARSGFAEARVSRTRTLGGDDPASERAALYDMVTQMMSDMNVEFEYQVRRSLRDYLQPATAGVAPAPAPVQSQDLAPPPTLAPPPQVP